MNPRTIAKNRNKLYLVLALLALSSLLAGCIGSWHVQNATGTDYIWSVEERANGINVVWFRYDDVGAYCATKDVATHEQLLELMRSRQLVEFEYSDFAWGLMPANPCYQAESSIDGAGFHAYNMTSIKLAGESQ